MKWVTVDQLAKQAGRHKNSVRRGLRRAGLMPDLEPGVRGKRIPVAKANRFLAKQWPGAPLFSAEDEKETQP